MRTLALTLLAPISGAAWGSPPMLPPDLRDRVYFPDLADVAEPPIWEAKSLEHNVSRIRLSVTGIVCRSYVFRIDVRYDGSARGIAKSWNRCRAGTPFSEERFRLKTHELVQLNAAFERASLWRFRNQAWTSPEGDICVDGELMTFERLDASGYRFAEANAQCEAPRELIDAARTLITLSRQPRTLGLLQ